MYVHNTKPATLATGIVSVTIHAYYIHCEVQCCKQFLTELLMIKNSVKYCTRHIIDVSAVIEEGQWSKHSRIFYSFCLSLSLSTFCLSTLDCVPLEIQVCNLLVGGKGRLVKIVLVQIKVVALSEVAIEVVNIQYP